MSITFTADGSKLQELLRVDPGAHIWQPKAIPRIYNVLQIAWEVCKLKCVEIIGTVALHCPRLDLIYAFNIVKKTTHVCEITTPRNTYTV